MLKENSETDLSLLNHTHLISEVFGSMALMVITGPPDNNLTSEPIENSFSLLITITSSLLSFFCDTKTSLLISLLEKGDHRKGN
jgi:hypothetical protein